MIGRTRNYSLKTLYHPKPQVKEEEPLATKPKLTMGKILPTIAQTRQLQKTQAKELGINIKKFQNIVSQKDSDNQEEMIRTAYFVIKNFAQVDNNFKDLFADLHHHLKQYLFLNQPDICSKYRIKQGATYKKAVKIMDKTTEEWIKKKNEEISALQQQMLLKEQTSKNEIERLSIQCFRLNEQVEKYKKIANVEYVRSLQVKVANLKETVSSQEEDYKVLAKKNEQCSKEIQFLRSQVNDLQNNNAMLQEKVYDLAILKEKSEIYLLKTKDKIEQLKNRMQSMKEVISKVQKQNETLVAERAKLVNRAAVSFEDLTPRPNYSDYFTLDSSININPTNHIFKGMIESIDIGQKKELFDKFFLAKKNRKLMQCEAIRQKTVQELLQSKAEINKIQ